MSTKSKSTPPRSFVFRGIKFTLDRDLQHYRHKRLECAFVELDRDRDRDTWTAGVFATVSGHASDEDPVRALELACDALESNANDWVQEITDDVAPALKVAKAKSWA